VETGTLIRRLERRLAHERMLAAISELLLTGTDRDSVLDEVCRLAGETAAVSRCYIFENFDNGERTRNTVEWTAPGIEAVKDGLQDVPYDGVRYWKITLEKGEMIRADDIRTLPAEVVEILSWQGIDSLLAVPLRLFDRWYGFLGFDVCGSTRCWDDDDVAMLVTVARLVSAYMEKETLRLQLIRSSRLSAVGSLAAGIGHEFNNIHAGIRGLAELNLEDRTLPERAAADLRRILGLVDRGVDLTHRLLGLSRQRTRNQPVNLKQVISDVAVLLERTFSVERIGFEFSTALDEAWVLGTPADLGHVMLALLQNAAEAVSEAPEKKISVNLHLLGPERYEVSVCDSGPGIPEAHLDSVFEPFFTTKGKLGGGMGDNAGLGLSVALSIAIQLGGKLSAGNLPRHGAVFTLELPAAASERTGTETALPSIPRSEARIGILEDEERIADMVGRALRKEGHYVEWFGSLAEATNAVLLRRYDVFLLDIGLRDGSGRELLEQISLLAPTVRPRTIVISGRDEGTVREALAGIPFDAFMPKPFPSLRELTRLVVRLLGT